MGCFGSKEAQKDNFSGTGRVLGSTPAPRTSAPIPSTTSQSRPTASSGAPGQTVGPPSTGDDPRAAAARAAEVCQIYLLHLRDRVNVAIATRYPVGPPLPTPLERQALEMLG